MSITFRDSIAAMRWSFVRTGAFAERGSGLGRQVGDHADLTHHERLTVGVDGIALPTHLDIAIGTVGPPARGLQEGSAGLVSQRAPGDPGRDTCSTCVIRSGGHESGSMSVTGESGIDFESQELAGHRIGIGIGAGADGRIADHFAGNAVHRDKQLMTGRRGIQDCARPHQREIIGIEGVESFSREECCRTPGGYLDAGDVVDIGGSGKACAGGGHVSSLPQGNRSRCGERARADA